MAGVIERTLRRRILIFAVIAAALLFILTGTFRPFVLSGASDAPTLLVNDRVVVNRMAYDLFVPFTETRLFSWGNPARGDIVLCRFPGEGDGNPWLKRVVGLPGDTIELRGPRLVVNGQELSYEILDRADFGPLRIEAGRYFVLGDSRDNSRDSRSLGPVSRRQIIGTFAWILFRGK